MRKNPLGQMLAIGVATAAIGIAIGLIIPWYPSDASLQAHHFRTLYEVLIIVSVPIFVLVETVVLYSVWKFRMKAGEEEKDGPPIHGNTRLEVIWTAVPAILIVVLCTYAYTVLRSNETSHPHALLVNVTERQFGFEFSYPQNHGKQQIVSSELYLPNRQPVLFHLRSLDVIHSFFVPEFSEKIDAVPGITTDVKVTPTRIGTYPAECTELCGAGHSLMRATVRVVSDAAFTTWLSSQKPGSPPPVGMPPQQAGQAGVPGAPSAGANGSSSGSSSAGIAPSGGSSSAASASAGKALFVGSGGCAGCHTLTAAGSTGVIGPNLSRRLASDCATAGSTKIRGKTLTECIHTAITRPYAYLPSGFSAGVMPPNFSQRLSPTQIQSLVNFISSVTK